MKRSLVALLLVGSAASGMQQSPSSPVASPALNRSHRPPASCIKWPNRHRQRCSSLPASVAVNPTQTIGPNTSDGLGADLIDTNGANFSQTQIATAFSAAGTAALRMPAGYIANAWDQRDNAAPSATPCSNTVWSPDSDDTLKNERPRPWNGREYGGRPSYRCTRSGGG